MTFKKEIIKEMTVDKLNVTVFDSADIMADAASSFVEKKINGAINKRGFANIILATGSSQFLFIEALKKKRLIGKKSMFFIWMSTKIFQLITQLALESI